MLPAKPPKPLHDPGLVADDKTAESTAHQEETPGDLTDLATQPEPQGDAEEGEIPSDQQPPLPNEVPPPLPNEKPPSDPEDDGWEPVWDETAQAFYFYNKLTNLSQWENPRVPQSTTTDRPRLEDTGPPGATSLLPKKPTAGGYDPAIHGDYDPTADYAKVYKPQSELANTGQPSDDPAAGYAATAQFNRFTGKWQSADVNPEKFSDESKSKRQMNAFFDVDAAANAHNGRSLKAERSSKKITKAELKAFRDKRKEKKEEKRRAWLRE